MRAFGKWLLLALCLFGGAAGGYHAYLQASPKKVLVILDASFPMGPVWEQVPPLLNSVAGRRYSVFALATDKGRIHGWQRTLELGRAVPYAPRNLKDLPDRLQLPELGEATETVLITNADPREMTTKLDWKVLRPAP
jgi:hypothetical protein